ncbi:hypothetical protein [Proteus sp. FME41]|uniref:hypothetical protein n=1 Tax=Proteus sp. FME41 TaxID=2742608 RepID=UPI0018670590|nr:hypothetical protein [Proteus sp. FME41]
MISIKMDDFRLNKILTSDQNSENKTIFSKKSLLLSANVGLSNIEKNDLLTEDVSKIKQKLADFYNLEHDKNIDSKHNLKIKSKDKKDKDEEYDCLNIEGLLLTQRKIYSQICHHVNKDKIERKSLSNNGSQKISISTENKLKLTKGFQLDDGKNINIHDIRGGDDIKINELGTIRKDNKVNPRVEKIERKYQDSKILESDENRKVNKNDPYKRVESIVENKLLLKKVKRKSNSENSSINIEHDLIINGKYSNSQKIDNKDLFFNLKKQNVNIEKGHKEKIKEEITDISIFNSIKPEYQKTIPELLFNKTLIDIPALSLLHKHISTLTQPPSMTYVFKKWGSELHQIKMNFDTDRKIQLIASTGRVYQSSLENFNQYQGRLSLSLENDNTRWHINKIDHSDNNEDEK